MPSETPTEKHVIGFRNFVQKINDFESKLGTFFYNKKQNSVICAPSVQILLGLLYSGADGITASEIAALFGVDNKQTEILSHFKKFISSLEVPEIKIANIAYVAQDIAIKKEFIEKSELYFNTAISQIDFTKAVEAANTINKWVETKTEQLIKNLIESDDLPKDTKLVLLNAIYFKSTWEHPFDSNDTKDGDFHVSASKKITVKQMTQKTPFLYAEDQDYQYLSMPYKNDTLSMLIILPKDIKTFEEKDASKANLSSLKLETSNVTVVMPKFKVESIRIDWGKILKSEIPSAFNKKANLSGIAGLDVPLQVSNIIQKAYIKVDENGTEAAAATGVIVRRKRSDTYYEDRTFIVDRPFFYRVYLNSALAGKIPLFVGSICEPSFP